MTIEEIKQKYGLDEKGAHEWSKSVGYVFCDKCPIRGNCSLNSCDGLSKAWHNIKKYLDDNNIDDEAEKESDEKSQCDTYDMTHERFNQLIDSFENNRIKVLKAKNAKYAPANDALHNFHYGAQLDNSTTCQTIWHYMKKHMVALLDKIERNDWSDIDDVFEKMGDIMNYLDFMWCAANEEYEKQKNK